LEACGTAFNRSKIFRLLDPYSQKYGDSKTGSAIQLEHEMLREDLWITERKGRSCNYESSLSRLEPKIFFIFNNISEGKNK